MTLFRSVSSLKRKKGWSPVVRSSLLSILNPRARTNFSRDGLTTGIHLFVLGQHTATVCKFLCGQADRYAMVASRTGDPSLADIEILSAPDGVTLPQNFLMARGQWLRTSLIFSTCFGVYHNASEGLQNFRGELSAWETELTEYIPRDAHSYPRYPPSSCGTPRSAGPTG